MKKIVVALDGYSSCGKSTMAKDLAALVGYTFIDTGAMYRAVTLLALKNNLFDQANQIDENKLESLLKSTSITQSYNAQLGRAETFLNNESVEGEIRGMEVSSRVSLVAALPFVRTEMVRQQQLMGREGGVVMDGRDIGTTVFPQAELKIFVTASDQVRAMRRYKELQAKGEKVSIDEVLENLKERDYIDSHRQTSPLKQADDAVVLDNSNLTPSEQLAMILALFNERVK